jgi:hypothetical protein
MIALGIETCKITLGEKRLTLVQSKASILQGGLIDLQRDNAPVFWRNASGIHAKSFVKLSVPLLQMLLA